MAGQDDSTQAMPLADLVEEHAPALIAVAGAQRASSDDDIARALVAIWRAGPPYADEVERAKERLSARLQPRWSLAGHERAADDRSDPGQIDRIHRLAQSYRVAARRRRQAAILATVVIVLALAVIFVPRLRSPTTASPLPSTPGTSTAATPSTSSGTPTTTASPTPPPSTDSSTPASPPSTAANTALTCSSQSCLPERASGWAPRVVAAAAEHLDVDSVFSGNGIITATDLASDRTGRLLQVTVTAPTTGGTVDVWTAEDEDQLPACGDSVQAECRMITHEGMRIAVASTDDAIEARYGTGDSTVQILVRNAGRPIEVEAERVFDFLVDPRVQLPT